MMNFTGCTLLIKDDFGNILVLKKKVKKGQKEIWSLLTQKIKGKESYEKCINKSVNKILKTIVFDLKQFNEYAIDSENNEGIKVYLGDLKGKFVLDKSYDEAKWINKNDLDGYEFDEIDKKIIVDYYNL
ncbi:hypothetical protein [Clostridium saccharobutylicum]|uniref:Nudix hydrolase domain-containing protein n=1 Tax=Clostridium saccharobutylicum DSM 13864 TaxID=1345695 RepID=U5MVT6_CLOSA|nr:hypothetical protein [Clostridium saccharobutylicum]AGX43552.1 hypothetical protein CLSA_c25810 [Clostridium saccharobutylicum DSM 13864]AQR90850.1 hypothetical protein CLOSC_25710 [Clostridium saccharobutylicum]AQS00754.1 hypothetical protein CSACC_25780 [Clostridium saccharobutylicum]AQS10416.1 hypothetical protein CLOBY_25590 [Clostridium saccharobutylicum]AQS14737.1 hypothetical protein CLOSACC_25780 [Clostridium saccharobutylicum]